jgi:hypothetical protein
MLWRAALVVALWGCCFPVLGAKADEPRPPCSGDPVPAYPPAQTQHVTAVWLERDLGEDWKPAACLGWPNGPGFGIVALAGTFTEPGGMNAVRSRFAAVSAQDRILYWSDSRQRWRNLFSESWALSGPDRDSQRADFAPDQLTLGAPLFFWQRANELYGGAVYRLDVKTNDGIRLEAAEANVTPIRLFGIDLVPAEGQESHVWIDAAAPGQYRYYAISRVDGDIPFGVTRISLTTRIEAMFRYAAGIPVDPVEEAPPERP